MPFADLDGLEIAYECYGEGQPLGDHPGLPLATRRARGIPERLRS